MASDAADNTGHCNGNYQRHMCVCIIPSPNESIDHQNHHDQNGQDRLKYVRQTDRPLFFCVFSHNTFLLFPVQCYLVSISPPIASSTALIKDPSLMISSQ